MTNTPKVEKVPESIPYRGGRRKAGYFRCSACGGHHADEWRVEEHCKTWCQSPPACAACGVLFEGPMHQKYCTIKCRMRAYRNRNE